MTSEIKQRTVYQIVRTDKPNDGTDIYVGSTSLSLKKRLSVHRYHAKVCNGKLYTRMQEVGIYNWEIIPLLTYSCDKKTIRGFEQQWVELLKSDLNMISSSDTGNKWNHIGLNELKRKHYLNNIETKRYYCDVCNKAFYHSEALRRHLNTLKHSYAYMGSVD